MSRDNPEKIAPKVRLNGLSIDLNEVEKFQSETSTRINDSYMPFPSLTVDDSFSDTKSPNEKPNVARTADAFESDGGGLLEDKLNKHPEKVAPWSDNLLPSIYQNKESDFLKNRVGEPSGNLHRYLDNCNPSAWFRAAFGIPKENQPSRLLKDMSYQLLLLNLNRPEDFSEIKQRLIDV